MKKTFYFMLSLLLLSSTVSPSFALIAMPSPEPEAFSGSFPDVNPQSLTAEAIEYLAEKDTISGFPDGTYQPENRINKAAFAKILAEELFTDEEIAAASCENPFNDVGEKWYTDYVCILKDKGIVTGTPEGNFEPTAYMNFAEGARMITEGYDIVGEPVSDKWFAANVDGLQDRNAIPLTISTFNDELTRAETAEIAYRISAEKNDKNSLTYEEIEEPLPYIASCSVLEEKFEEYQYRNNNYYYYDDVIMVDEADMDGEMALEEAVMMNLEVAPAVASDSISQSARNVSEMPKSGGGSEEFSETNLQVAGVDEADMIKNDGQYIYVIKDSTLRIVDAFPLEDGMEEIAILEFNQDEDNGYGGFYPSEMYVTEDRLVVMGQDSHYYYYDTAASNKVAGMTSMPAYNSDQTKIFVFDISDRSEPELLRETAFDGYYQSSRRIGDQVYLVMNAQPYYWNYQNVDSGEDLLPMMKDGDKAPEPMAGCTDIRYFPGHETPSFLMVASMDINDTDETIQSNVVLGNSNNYYMSPTDLFVANTVYGPQFFNDWNWSREEQETNVFRFAIDDGDIEFKSRGSVPGQILNQFSMDQHDDYFRIATTTGNIWNDANPSKNNVYILDADMQRVGTLEGLAKGEEIKSTRFIGDRLYMVTFVQVDPLFVIDLENPRNPQVLGELKLPGFSEYLHPYDEDHLIGFGRDTTLDEYENVRLDGFKMALFDVSDVRNPKVKFEEVIGGQGTYSELLYNHKALLFDKEKDLISFPIEIVELQRPQDLMCGEYTMSTCPYQCIQACVGDGDTCEDVAGSCVAPTYEQYETTFSGALVYDIDTEDGFTERGRITHYDEEDKDDYYGYSDYRKNIQRILYIGDYFYTVAQGGIMASDMDTIEEVEFVELEQDESYYEDEYYIEEMPVDMVIDIPFIPFF